MGTMEHRQKIRKRYTEEILDRLKEEGSDYFSYSIDGAYCEGYNIVLDAAKAVLSGEDYKKIIDWLDEHDC